ncbi:glycosyltransferase family 4 protein [Deminuibacter soli]|uniref:Glycosyltransferase family 1 protein n=1 Tax=Deminuibacter soli TaxID=2291815 RepID=A0A3E1NCS5_9BACT|nr:glycosyltransferase family 1 protein [Deminuibacter soli]RFM25809.1 glycosyltransferase family 1 protein [Deminuibacter soli]
MNIGFEAKRAYTNGTGLGHYSRTLISSLAAYYPGHEYFLFTPKHTNRFNALNFANVHEVIPSRFPGNIFTSAWRSSWVKKDLRLLDINLYHGLSHEIPMGIAQTGIPSVVTMHDLIFERYPNQYKPLDVLIYRNKFKYACKNASRIIAISKQTRDDLVQFYQVDEKKIDICYQSCNPAFGEQQTATQLQQVKMRYNLPDKFFLYVGSVIERKNLLLICQALRAQPSITIPLVVIGDGGAYKQQVQQYIKDNGLTGRVIFLSDKTSAQLPGYQSAADFPAIYQQALCMIYPSVFEGFGIPVLEALWSGLPVITSNVSCLPEAGGDAALYIDPHSVSEMAAALTDVAGNSALRDTMIERGYRHAQRFSQQQCAEAVMQTYLRTV